MPTARAAAATLRESCKARTNMAWRMGVQPSCRARTGTGVKSVLMSDVEQTVRV